LCVSIIDNLHFKISELNPKTRWNFLYRRYYNIIDIKQLLTYYYTESVTTLQVRFQVFPILCRSELDTLAQYLCIYLLFTYRWSTDLPSIYIVHTALITTLLYVYMHTYDYAYMYTRILLWSKLTYRYFLVRPDLSYLLLGVRWTQE